MYIFFSIGFAHIGRVGSVAVTISIAVERYMSVCHPTNSFPCKYLLFPLPIAFALLYNIPKFFEIVVCSKEEMYQTMIKDISLHFKEREAMEDKLELFSNNTNKTISLDGMEEDDVGCDIYGTRATSLRNNRWYIILYVFLSELILVEIVPWITVIILNICIWKGIRRFQKRRQSLKNKSSNVQGKYKN